MASARIIDDISKASYPEGIKSPRPRTQCQRSGGPVPVSLSGHPVHRVQLITVIARYDRDLLVQFMKVCVEQPNYMPDLDALGIAMNGESSALSGPQCQHTGSSMGPPNCASAAGLSFRSSNSAFGGGMGNLTSACAKSTSADRFAASSNVMSRQQRRYWAWRNRSSVAVFSSQGSIGMLLHDRKDSHSTQRARLVLVAEGARISLTLDQVQRHTFRARPSKMLPSSPSHLLSAARIVGYQKCWVAGIPPLPTLSPTIRLSSSANSRVSSISSPWRSLTSFPIRFLLGVINRRNRKMGQRLSWSSSSFSRRRPTRLRVRGPKFIHVSAGRLWNILAPTYKMIASRTLKGNLSSVDNYSPNIFSTVCC